MATVPSLEQLKKEGESGRKIINQYTRYLTVVLAAFQAWGIAVGLEGSTNVVLKSLPITLVLGNSSIGLFS